MRMTTVLSLIAIACLVAVAAAHGTRYPHIEMARAKGMAVAPEAPPGILSWHVHITYTVFHHDVKERAMKLREMTRAAFADYLAPDCSGRYDYGVLCLIDDHNFNVRIRGWLA